MTFAPMPEDWTPQTTDVVRHGRTMRFWYWKGHELAYRGTSPAAWDTFKRECWLIVQRLEAGETHVPHAHKDRHDPAKRPVSKSQRLDPHAEDDG